MDTGTWLALRAIINTLREAGHLSPSAMAVLVDELRYAARDAREGLYVYDADALDRLSLEFVAPRHNA